MKFPVFLVLIIVLVLLFIKDGKGQVEPRRGHMQNPIQQAAERQQQIGQSPVPIDDRQTGAQITVGKMDNPKEASEGKLSFIISILLPKAETKATPASPNPVDNLPKQSLSSDDTKLEELQLMVDILELIQEYEESLSDANTSDEDDEEDEDDIRYSLTDLLADDPDDDSSKSNVGDDAAQPSIKIGCGEEQYACGDQCYPTMKFNGKPLQYRCENNVLDKSKFTVKLNFHFDTIEETDNFFKNGARVVFDD